MLKGIDISYHNGEIDFAKLKSQVDFIIMRSGYGTKTTDSKEVKFDLYYEEAKKQNIPVGTSVCFVFQQIKSNNCSAMWLNNCFMKQMIWLNLPLFYRSFFRIVRIFCPSLY